MNIAWQSELKPDTHLPKTQKPNTYLESILDQINEIDV
jgi:hypothetical protein